MTDPREPFAYLVVNQDNYPADVDPRDRDAGAASACPTRAVAEMDLQYIRSKWEPLITRILNSRHPEDVPSFRVVGLVELDDQ